MTRDEDRFVFENAADARAYLVDVARLWGGWVVGLTALVLLEGRIVGVVAIVLLVGMLLLSKPFHRRARQWVADDEVVGSKLQVAFGRGTKRDLMLRKLMYGSTTMGDALRVAGLPARLLVLRGTVVVGTVVAAFVILFRP